MADLCLVFVCICSGRILHSAAGFDRERLYGPSPLSSELLDVSVRVTSRQMYLFIETDTDTRILGALQQSMSI